MLKELLILTYCLSITVKCILTLPIRVETFYYNNSMSIDNILKLMVEQFFFNESNENYFIQKSSIMEIIDDNEMQMKCSSRENVRKNIVKRSTNMDIEKKNYIIHRSSSTLENSTRLTKTLETRNKLNIYGEYYYNLQNVANYENSKGKYNKRSNELYFLFGKQFFIINKFFVNIFYFL